jgi:ATP-dependent Clp protease protease subunit
VGFLTFFYDNRGEKMTQKTKRTKAKTKTKKADIDLSDSYEVLSDSEMQQIAANLTAEELAAAHIGAVYSDIQPEIKLRSMIVTGPVDEDMSSGITRNLLTMNAEDPFTPIVMYLNTYGGTVHDMMAIYDVMQFIKAPIYSVGFGKVMSAGVLLLAAGEAGHRYALPHTSIMIHRIRGGALGTVEDIEASGDHMASLQSISETLLFKHTKITKKQMKDFMSGADSYIDTTTARKLGLIDHISAVTPKALL